MKCILTNCYKEAAPNRQYCSYVHYLVNKRLNDGSLKDDNYLLREESDFGNQPEIISEAKRLNLLT